LLDTGSDVTISDVALALKMQWSIRPAKLQSVKAANNEKMTIEGVCTANLSVGNQTYCTNILVTSEMERLVLGANWMSQKGKVV